MGRHKWVVSPLVWVIIMVALLKTPLITTHEPPSIEACRRPVEAF